jgi:hypothetical protein
VDEGIKHILLAGGVYSNSNRKWKVDYNATNNKVHDLAWKSKRHET